MSEYHLLPTRLPRRKSRKVDGKWVTEYSKPRPEGWVELGPYYEEKTVVENGQEVKQRIRHKGILGPTRRRIDEGYLKIRLNRNTSVAMRQQYVTKVAENPRTPQVNRDAVVAFVKKFPERFVPVADNPNDPEYQRWANLHNGDSPQKGFVSRFLRKYGKNDGGDGR